AGSRHLVREPGLERATDAAMERADLRRIRCAGAAPGIDSPSPKRLVGVDVPDAGEVSLIEESGLDRGPPPLEPFRQLGRGKSALERLEPEARRQVRVELVRAQDKPRSEPANTPVRTVRAVGQPGNRPY